MYKAILIGLSIFLLAGCIALPVEDKEHKARCEMSSDMKTLKVFNLAKESNSYYSVQGLLLTPIILPTSFIISGSYTLVNNAYYLGKEKIECGKGEKKISEVNQG